LKNVAIFGRTIEVAIKFLDNLILNILREDIKAITSSVDSCIIETIDETIKYRAFTYSSDTTGAKYYKVYIDRLIRQDYIIYNIYPGIHRDNYNNDKEFVIYY